MLEACPRSALLHYREARLGIIPEADDEYRSLYLMRSKLPISGYLRKLLRDVMRGNFYAPILEDGAVPYKKDIGFAALRKFDAAIENMLRAKEFSVPVIKELYEETVPIAELIKYAKEELLLRCEALQKGAWGKLAEIPSESRRMIDSPLEVCINELRCYCAPLCAFEEHGDMWFIDTGLPDDRVALLYKFYACNILARSPENVRIFHLDDINGDFAEFGLTLDVSSALRQISENDAIWTVLLEKNIADAEVNRAYCSKCNFRRFCTNLP